MFKEPIAQDLLPIVVYVSRQEQTRVREAVRFVEDWAEFVPELDESLGELWLAQLRCVLLQAWEFAEPSQELDHSELREQLEVRF